MTEQEAKQKAEELIKTMKSEGWTASVGGINDHHHYYIFKGNLQVIPNGNQTYLALLGSSPHFLSWRVRKKNTRPSGAPSFWGTEKAINKDPNKAVEEAVKAARRFVDEVTMVVLDAEATTHKHKKSSKPKRRR